MNPKHLENQVEGAAVMAIGGALFEEIMFADGRLQNGRVSSRLPRAALQRSSRSSRLYLVNRTRICRPPAPERHRSLVWLPLSAIRIFQATGVHACAPCPCCRPWPLTRSKRVCLHYSKNLDNSSHSRSNRCNTASVSNALPEISIGGGSPSRSGGARTVMPR